MKRIIFGLLLVGMVVLYYGIANAACPTSHAVQHPNGAIDMGASTCPSCVPRYWCLSGGAANNNGTNTAWWQNYNATNIWWFNGDWMDPGVNGCCGMWDSGTFGSQTMMAVVDSYANEGAANHFGRYVAQVDERSTFNAFTFDSVANDTGTEQIPSFHMGSFTQGAPGGSTILSMNAWESGAAAGPAHYFISRFDNTDGHDLALQNYCSPNGTTACPAPITGYQIRARFMGCLDGTCANKTAQRPTSSLVSYWTVAGSTITPRVPASWPNSVTVANPATNLATNCYLWWATQLMYADGFVSTYVGGSRYSLRWFTTFGAEIDSIAAKYVTQSDVKVSWVSVSEGNIFGYNVYRSFSPTGTFTKVNARVIPTMGQDAIYAYKDRVISPAPRAAYYQIGLVRDIATGKDEIVKTTVVARPGTK